MFSKLKEKLLGWFSKSKETIEKEAEKVEKKDEISKSLEKIKKIPKKISEKEDLEKKSKKGLKKKYLEKKEEEKSSKLAKKEELLKNVSEKKVEYEKQKSEEELKKIEEAEKKKKLKEERIEELKREIEKDKQILAELGDEIEKKEIKSEPKETFFEKIEEVEEKPKKSFFSRLKSTFVYKISEEEFNEIFDDLELLLLENNVALEVIEDIKKRLSNKLIGREIKEENLEDEIKNELKKTLEEILIEPDNPLEIIKISEKPFVILFFGINGTGKTTSIAKVAYFLKNAGFSVVLGAGDTFRAASIEQLSEHAKKLNIPIVKQSYGADPSAVGFDAIKYAKNHKIDVVLIDTAGRMHTRTNLISEMEKIARVTKPNLKIFVAESIAGNDATEQAKIFNEAIEIDGSILSKADIDEKGGTIISVSYATHKPIFYLGTGQNYEDLELFNKQKFIESLGL